MTTRLDATLDAIYRALERWDAEERRVRTINSITKAKVRRATRTPRGDRIVTPRRTALARYITDAVLTALREYDATVDGLMEDADRDRELVREWNATLPPLTSSEDQDR